MKRGVGGGGEEGGRRKFETIIWRSIYKELIHRVNDGSRGVAGAYQWLRC